MSVVVPYRAIEAVSKSTDPKAAILGVVGDLSGIEVIGDLVLLGIYVRPEKTRGGIIRPDANVAEDIWQGKVGLVLKCGPDAFRDPETGELYEQHAKVGEWVACKVGDGWQVEVNGWPCRLALDRSVKLKVKNPTAIL